MPLSGAGAGGLRGLRFEKHPQVWTRCPASEGQPDRALGLIGEFAMVADSKGVPIPHRLQPEYGHEELV